MSENEAVALLELPTSPIKVVTKNPRKLLIYSNPKGGKTTIVAGLKNNLIVDLEGGSHFVEAMKIDATNLDAVRAVIKALYAGHKYDSITIDPITRLEDIVLPAALKLYKKTPQGKSFIGDNVLYLPNGGGYLYLRRAFFTVLNHFAKLTDQLIITGHVRDKLIEKNGKEVNYSEVNLTGKIKSMLCADVDAIAYLDRRGPDGFFRFATADDVICGARPPHLRNKEIHISHLEDDGSVTTYWDQIYLPQEVEKKQTAKKSTIKKTAPKPTVEVSADVKEETQLEFS